MIDYSVSSWLLLTHLYYRLSSNKKAIYVNRQNRGDFSMADSSDKSETINHPYIDPTTFTERNSYILELIYILEKSAEACHWEIGKVYMYLPGYVHVSINWPLQHESFRIIPIPTLKERIRLIPQDVNRRQRQASCKAWDPTLNNIIQLFNLLTYYRLDGTYDQIRWMHSSLIDYSTYINNWRPIAVFVLRSRQSIDGSSELSQHRSKSFSGTT